MSAQSSEQKMDEPVLQEEEKHHAHPLGPDLQKRLAAEGKPGHPQEAGPEHRQPGEYDEAGNKIPHKHFLGRLLHGESTASNK